MPNQPENPKHACPPTERDHQGPSIAIDPETATYSNKDEPRDETHQQGASGSMPRSMPWPEAPTTRPSSQKKQAPRPTKPSLVDEWPVAFQEPEPAFPFTGPSSVDKQSLTPKAPTQGKRSDSASSLNREEGWVPNSRNPQHPVTSKNLGPSTQTRATTGPETSIPAPHQSPGKVQVPGSITQTPAATPPFNAKSPLSPGQQWATPSSEQQQENPGKFLVGEFPSHVETMPPSPPTQPSVPAPPLPGAPQAPTPVVPEGPQAEVPAPSNSASASMAPAQPPPAFAPIHAASTILEDERAAAWRDQQQTQASHAPSYPPMPGPTPETSIESMSPRPVGSAHEVAGITPQETAFPSGVQPLINTPAPAVPAPNGPPLPESKLSPTPLKPSLDNQREVVLHEQPYAKAASTAATYTPVPTSQAPVIDHANRPTSPIAPTPGTPPTTSQEPPPALIQNPGNTVEPPRTPIAAPDWQVGQEVGALSEQQKLAAPTSAGQVPQQGEQIAFGPSAQSIPEPSFQSSSAQSVPHQASTSLDEEWVASMNEAQEELNSTGVSSYSTPGSPPIAPLGGPHQPKNFVPPNEWIPENRQQSSSQNKSTSPPHFDSRASDLQTSPPDVSQQQGPVPRRSEMAEDSVPISKDPTGHIVQAWPSARSEKASTITRSAQDTLDSEGWDKGVYRAVSAAQGAVTNALQAATDVTSALDTGRLDPNGYEEVEYAPLRLRHPVFTGDGGTLFGIFTTNTVWTVLTFGIYSFWGRINIRRYLHSQTKFAGARFEFHGTGGELLLGWLKALLALGIPYSGLNYVSSQHAETVWQWSLNGLTGLLVVCLIPIAIVGSHRYRMSRTSWRGIRFSFRRSITAFTVLYLKGMLLSIVTLGIYYPAFVHARREFLTSGTHFGNRAFGFDGDPQNLGQLYFKAFRRFVLTLVTAEVFLLATSFLAAQFHPEQVVDLVFLSSVGTGAIVIPILLGLWFWFQAAKQRYMWNHTTFGHSRFRATMKGRHLFELKCTNLILLIGSLGLAWPWVRKRNLQFLYYHLGFRGPLQLKSIMQQADSASPMGEELAGFFDAGFEM